MSTNVGLNIDMERNKLHAANLDSQINMNRHNMIEITI